VSGVAFHKLPARSGEASLRLEAGETPVWVHSPVDPRREATAQLERLGCRPGDLVVAVGGGLGWLALAARERDDVSVLLLEPLESPPGLALERDLPVARGDAGDLLAVVTREQQRRGWPDLLVVHNPAYGRAFPAWAARLLESLRPGRLPSRVRQAGGVDGRSWPPRTVLLPDAGYFLTRELDEAFQALGLRTLRVPLRLRQGRERPGTRSGLEADADYVDRLLAAVLEGKPDLVVAVNHLGLDRDGRVQELLAGLRVPLAVWYVDSPEFILDDAPCLDTERSVLFCWERAWIPRLREVFRGPVFHLPLAGSPSFLREPRPRRDLSLVAGSNAGALRKWRERLSCPPALRPELDDLLDQAVSFARGALPGAELERRMARGAWPGLAAGLDAPRRRALESLLVLRATRDERLALARAFFHDDFTLHGDEGWRGELPERLLRPPLDYYRGLAEHYRGTRVSLNTTSRQMPGTVNQRLFDAPLAGSAVLTDQVGDLEELFEPGVEVATHATPAEALETARRLLRDEPARRRLVERARARILAEHVYTHRVTTMLERIGATREEGPAAPQPRPRAEEREACASW
jgi:spore maturation protein CgeB